MSGIKRLKVWKVTALFSALLMLPLFSPAAQADGLSLGALFRIGGVHFNLTLADFGHGHPRGYYYRTADPISYHNVRCNSYCLNSGGYHYHHESCPLVRSHLAYFDVDPLGLFDRYAPGYGSRHGYGQGYGDRYNSYNGYNGYNNYNRYDRHDGYHRQDRRRDGYNRYDRYPYPDRRQGYDRDHSRRDRHDRRDRDRGRHDRDRDRGRNDRNDRNDGRHDRHDGGHQGGHSSNRPQQH